VIFGDTAHIEIVKRANVLLNFLAHKSNGDLDASIVDLTWRCQEGKHEEMVRTVYNLIENLLPHVNLSVFDLYFQKISKDPKIDSKFLSFLKEFSIRALTRQYDVLNDEYDQHNPDTFDNHLVT